MRLREACCRGGEAKRPDDPDVMRARLLWALDAGRPEEAVRAAARLPTARLLAADVAAIGARLAAIQGDGVVEREMLERRVDLEPGDLGAWDRLAELATVAGLGERAAECRRRKAEINRARDQYRMSMASAAAGNDHNEGEMARAAEALGRRFEAKGWWSLEARRDPDDQEARSALDRLARVDGPTAGEAGMLLELLPGSLRTASQGDVKGRAAVRAALSFSDKAEVAGLRVTYQNDATPLCRMPESIGGGVGLLDYDGDGWLDVYAVQGGTLSNESVPGPTEQRDRLFRNRGNGTFEDVTERSGLARFSGGYGHGVAVADYDNDGWPDLFITRWRSYALYRNRGDGKFDDATAVCWTRRGAGLADVVRVWGPRCGW